MAPASRRAPRSLVPVIVLLSVVLAGLIAVIVLRGSDAPAGGTTVAQTVPTPGPAARPPTATVAAATAALDGRPARRDTSAWTTRGARAKAAAVPILMWHVVATPRPGTPYPDLWVTPEAFAAQVAGLRDAGFTAVTMHDVWTAWKDGTPLPRRPVVLSFDDGDLSHVTNVAPVLSRERWPGVLNLAVNHLGPKGLPMWGARRLIREGWEIDSHTVDHLDLTTLDDAALADQLVRSRRLIKSRLGVSTRFLCYPAGRNDDRVRAAALQAGYVAATTVEPGIAAPADDPFLLPRIRVGPGTTPEALVQQARGTAAPPAGGGPA
ncbi:polysaccharide deacetylase family protein [Patulibacter sp. NPDC049589]|uniref:polysaccharide deacetylase family protein n=1 Tax=Patulibacter sp. NPDC049589 TaxID=3154731 RepID=UPI00343F9DFF